MQENFKNRSVRLLPTAMMAVAFLMFPVSLSAQVCNCPEDDCSSCQSGITSVTLQYKGNGPAEIFAKDVSNIKYSAVLKQGDIFTVNGGPNFQRFTGNKLDIFVDNTINASLNTNCNGGIRVNVPFGNFVVVSARSGNGEVVCCSSVSYTRDNVAPWFKTVPTDIEAASDPGACGASVTWPAPVVEDCNLKSVVSNPVPGTQFPVGVTNVSYTATDQAGNVTRFVFKVSVIDRDAPQFVRCPSDTTVSTAGEASVAVSWNGPVVAEACEVSQLTSTKNPGDVFTLGENEVVYTVRDKTGNSATCTFRVTVKLGDVDLDISQIITPDNNGLNDVWKIGNIEKYIDNKVLIFDRWGGEIFNRSGYNNASVSWNGRNSDSQLLPSGTYFYSVMVVVDGKKVEKNGYIELIR
jgi:gliding motility-associated-like protein